jgi:hypothetical protein
MTEEGKVWIYCDECQATRPLLGGHVELPNRVGAWKDLCCSVCYSVIATISRGDDEGNEPPSPR